MISFLLFIYWIYSGWPLTLLPPPYPAQRGLKNWVVAAPELREDALSAASKVLVVATDGLWDVVGNEEAVRVAAGAAALAAAEGAGADGPERAARALVALAYERGSFDNISAVVALFAFGGASGAGNGGGGGGGGGGGEAAEGGAAAAAPPAGGGGASRALLKVATAARDAAHRSGAAPEG